jgi:hypothetical protein
METLVSLQNEPYRHSHEDKHEKDQQSLQKDCSGDISQHV